MLEKVVEKKIKEHLKTKYKATVHKYHGTATGETGHADLYGTLPNGQAYFVEVKSPTSRKDRVREQYQRIFMYRERLNGALVGFARCIEDVDKIINGEEMLWMGETPKN